MKSKLEHVDEIVKRTMLLERERCAVILDNEARKIELEGGPTTAMIIRNIAKKIRKNR